MTEGYNPESRRPIASILRRTANGATQWCVHRGIHPDTVSSTSIAASGLAGLLFWQAGNLMWLVIPAALLCYGRLWLNMLDGMVALASGKASPRGEIFNELPDRVSDIVIFAGVAHSGLSEPILAYWVIIMGLATAYIGTFGQAIGVGRQFGGIMAKPWRMVVLHLGSWLMLGMLVMGQSPAWAGLSIVDWSLLVIIAGCAQTILVRLNAILTAVGRP